MWCRSLWFALHSISNMKWMHLIQLNTLKTRLYHHATGWILHPSNKEIMLHMHALYQSVPFAHFWITIKLNRSCTDLYSTSLTSWLPVSSSVSSTQVSIGGWPDQVATVQKKLNLTHCCDGWKTNIGDRVCDRPGSATHTRTSTDMWVTWAYIVWHLCDTQDSLIVILCCLQ